MSDDGLTYEELVEATKGDRALVKHFDEVKGRVFGRTPDEVFADGDYERLLEMAKADTPPVTDPPPAPN